MDLDEADVIALIKEAGMKVVLMDSIQERIKGHEMTAYVRRVYQKSFLTSELAWLKKKKVKTIGLHSVTPIHDRNLGGEEKGATIAVTADGIRLRWAYEYGV
ncbi:MAG: hypothetical protein ACXABY_18395 [Candidatus Thorarchaeota archaeon]|jgi:hypothetical protein